MSKHTPGPWTFRPDVVDKGYYIETEDMSHNNTFIGDIGGGLQSKGEIKANAKLIAAAPDLIEALESIAEDIETLQQGGDIKLVNDCYLTAKAAIKKATE